jgi:hypothetical protein
MWLPGAIAASMRLRSAASRLGRACDGARLGLDRLELKPQFGRESAWRSRPRPSAPSRARAGRRRPRPVSRRQAHAPLRGMGIKLCARRPACGRRAWRRCPHCAWRASCATALAALPGLDAWPWACRPAAWPRGARLPLCAAGRAVACGPALAVLPAAAPLPAVRLAEGVLTVADLAVADLPGFDRAGAAIRNCLLRGRRRSVAGLAAPNFRRTGFSPHSSSRW